MPNLQHSPSGATPGATNTTATATIATGTTPKTTGGGRRPIRQPAHLKEFEMGGVAARRTDPLLPRRRNLGFSDNHRRQAEDGMLNQGRINPYLNTEGPGLLDDAWRQPTASGPQLFNAEAPANYGNNNDFSSSLPNFNVQNFSPSPNFNGNLPNNFSRPVNINSQIPPLSISNQDIGKIVSQVVCSMINMNLINNNCNNNESQNTTKNYAKELKNLPSFDDTASMHPIDFLQQIESVISVNTCNFRDFCSSLINLFKGKARLWADAFLFSFESYQEFKFNFSENFWGATRQLQVKLRIESGRFTDGSFVDHFNLYVGLAKHLQPPFPTELLISSISRHFPPNISVLLVGAATLEQALSRLRQADYYFGDSRNFSSPLQSGVLGSGLSENTRREQNRNFSSGSFENTRKEQNKNYNSYANKNFDKNRKQISSLEIPENLESEN